MTQISVPLRPSFRDYAGQLEALLERLKVAQELPLSDPSKFPRLGGCYVIIEDGRYLYVGMFKNLRQRMRNHTSGRAEQSVFALKLAREVTGRPRTYKKAGSSKDLMENDREFSTAMGKTTERVQKMSARFVVIEDPALRYLFEFYAARTLDTPYNDFNSY